MRYRVLGASGTQVSEISLGTMMFGGATEEAEARRIVDHALDAGVNFIDTANVYADERSEEIVGRAIKASRDRWVLATKVAGITGRGPNEQGLSRVHIMRSAEASLRRLQTDRIDLYYVHKLDPGASWEHVVLSFGDLIRQGKVREWGLSNVRAWHIPHIHHLCRALGVPAPAALQPYYNLMNREPEVELLPAARFFGLGVVPYSPVARGVLTGKYKANQAAEPGSRAARQDKRMMETEWRPESLIIAERLKAHAEARGASLVHWAVAWVLNNGAVCSSIAGPRTFEQWTSYLGALDYAWTPQDEVLADSLVPPGHPSTPGYSDPAYPVEGRFPVVG
ncbi:MAG: aldo/keto reductase [Hyphomicrobiaceae bacterium]|nr:MAG: aldo/keto reductase [Hyphomicrobiaceae bacterium]